jgi:hypothetical protein
MKVLIDEILPRKLAGHMKGHECRTVAECGWAGKKNGELPSLAEPQFDVLPTLDKNIPYQQDLKLGRIAIRRNPIPTPFCLRKSVDCSPIRPKVLKPHLKTT